MTTSHRSAVTINRFDRFVGWVLDHDGDIYGDERARLRWYEGLVFTTSVQWILVLWVLAVSSWIAPSSAAPYLWSVAAAFIVPMYLAVIYALRRGVDVTRPSMSRKSKFIQALMVIPLLIFIVGMTLGMDLRTGRSWSEISPALRGGAVGGCVGLVIAGAFMVVIRRRGEQRDSAETDLD